MEMLSCALLHIVHVDMSRAAAEGVTGYLLEAPIVNEVILAPDQQMVASNHRNFNGECGAQDAESEPFALVGEDLQPEPVAAISS
jgi:hypothetical protein